MPPRYHGFVTALVAGGPVDGFTDEGLAVVDAGGRRGVVDRTGAVIVPPAHPVLRHPPGGVPGRRQVRAVGRAGPAAASRWSSWCTGTATDVLEEIDRLLTDASPVL